MKPSTPVPKSLPDNTSADTPTSVARQLPNDPDFLRLAAAWPGLLEPIRRAIRVLIDRVVTDIGLLPLRWIDKQLGVLSTIAQRLPDPRMQKTRRERPLRRS
jgi:hypothetical protein